MKIERIRLMHFKSFEDSGWIELAPDVNIFAGENNAGKSALLQIFSEESPHAFHRSDREARPNRLTPSEQHVQFQLEPDEFEAVFYERINRGDLYWPVVRGATGAEPTTFFNQVSKWNGVRAANESWRSSRSPSHGLFDGPASSSDAYRLVNSQITRAGNDHGANDTGSDLMQLAITAGVFYFTAQRYSIGSTPRNQEHRRLNANASNLAGVLSLMQGTSTELFDSLVQHVREVFSTVGNLSVSPHGPANSDEILVWPTSSRLDPNLAFSLNESGTGVAQTIAILTVAMTMRRAVIAIDEISSFLHPSAAKALLGILLSEYSQHQYIITTHSADVISFAAASRTYLVRKAGYKSEVVPVNMRQMDDVRSVAGQLGISMTDVFAAEKIVWVEGPTEEKCFPMLADDRLSASVRFVSVVGTGDFTAKWARKGLVFKVYEAVSGLTHSLVNAVVFSFDAEGLSDADRAKISSDAGGKVLFLPRRNFESYLIDPDAISATIAADLSIFAPDDELTKTFSSTGRTLVLEAIDALAGQPQFSAAKFWHSDIEEEGWVRHVDGAKLLSAVFTRATGATLAFSKVRHAPMMLREILSARPGRLNELQTYVNSLLDLVGAAETT